MIVSPEPPISLPLLNMLDAIWARKIVFFKIEESKLSHDNTG